MPAVVRTPAWHSRRFNGERPIGAATGQQSPPPRPCANPPPPFRPPLPPPPPLFEAKLSSAPLAQEDLSGKSFCGAFGAMAGGTIGGAGGQTIPSPSSLPIRPAGGRGGGGAQHVPQRTPPPPQAGLWPPVDCLRCPWAPMVAILTPSPKKKGGPRPTGQQGRDGMASTTSLDES